MIIKRTNFVTEGVVALQRQMRFLPCAAIQMSHSADSVKSRNTRVQTRAIGLIGKNFAVTREIWDAELQW